MQLTINMNDKESKAIFEAYKQSKQQVIAEAKDDKGSTRSVADITTLINHILSEKGLPPVQNHEEIMHAAEQLKGADPVAGKRLGQLATDWEAAWTLENTVKPHLQQQMGNMNNPPIAGEQQGNVNNNKQQTNPPVDSSPFIESVDHPRIAASESGYYFDKMHPNCLKEFAIHLADSQRPIFIKAEDEQHARVIAQIVMQTTGGQIVSVEERHGAV